MLQTPYTPPRSQRSSSLWAMIRLIQRKEPHYIIRRHRKSRKPKRKTIFEPVACSRCRGTDIRCNLETWLEDRLRSWALLRRQRDYAQSSMLLIRRSHQAIIAKAIMHSIWPSTIQSIRSTTAPILRRKSGLAWRANTGSYFVTSKSSQRKEEAVLSQGAQNTLLLFVSTAHQRGDLRLKLGRLWIVLSVEKSNALWTCPPIPFRWFIFCLVRLSMMSNIELCASFPNLALNTVFVASSASQSIF